MNVRIGVMEGVLKQPRESVFAAAASLGFDGVEIEVLSDPEAIRSAAEESGVAICSLICGGEGLGSEVEEDRLVARARLADAVRDASDLGARGILLPHFELKDLDDSDRASRFIHDIRRCTAEAEACGVVIGWENSLDAEAVRSVIEGVDSPSFRCYFDLANAARRSADPAEELRRLGGMVYQVHAKNTHRQPLDGPGVDLPACLAALAERQYEGWIVLETAPGEDPLASAMHNLHVLRSALAL